MAKMKLVYGVTEVEFSPRFGYTQPDLLKVIRPRSYSGTLRTLKIYHKARLEPAIFNVLKADADNINSFWENQYDLTCYYDLENSPTLTITVKIVNTEKPLGRMFGVVWQEKFEGTLELEEI